MLIKDHAEKELSNALAQCSPLSLIVLSLDDINHLTGLLSDQKIGYILNDIEKIFNGNLRKPTDIAIKSSDKVVVLTADCNKEHADNVKQRLARVFEDYLKREKLDDKIQFKISSLSYPDEVKNIDEFWEKGLEG